MNAWKTEVLLPCDCGKKHGKITVCRLREKLIVLLIDIRSRYIPEILLPEEKRDYQSKTIYMNYCFQGRCELQLHNGEATFLNGGEFALDSGNAVQENQKFFYPLSHYEGIEICMHPEALPKDFDCRETAGTLLHICDELGRPYFASNNDKIQSLMSTIREDIISDGPRELLMLDIFRLLILANQLPFDKEERRTYFTPAQVEIAKKTMELLTSDLSRRTSAAVMAENFGVSETSLKNYFRAVYGQPYGECLNELRMDKAAKLLEDGTMKVAEIAAAVGYSSQSRFAKAFREIYGIPPLEYRRRAKLQQGINGETEEK